MSKLKFEIEIDTTSGVFTVTNTETGEVQTSTAKKTTTRKKKVVEDNNPIPQITLEENKYSLNTAAVKLLGVEPDDKLCIKTRKIGKTMTPVIGTPEAFKCKEGNRLTKSFTVSCRGANREALAAFGNVFTLVENPDGTGTFILTNNSENSPIIEEDDTIDENKLEDFSNELDNELVEDEIEEITGDDFFAALNAID